MTLDMKMHRTCLGGNYDDACLKHSGIWMVDPIIVLIIDPFLAVTIK